MSSWWPWSAQKLQPLDPLDAARHPALQRKFLEWLDYIEPPNTFRLSEVAHDLSDQDLQSMGYKYWREAMPGILALAWDKKEIGDCVILYKETGEKIPDDLQPEDLEGPIRIRRDAPRFDA